jgi:PspA-Associated protein
VILRILGEGQLEVSDEALSTLNELDDCLIDAVEKGDDALFATALADLQAKVREVGKPVPDDYLGPSELILPGPDATLDEVRELLSDEGLIPG